MNSNIAFLTTLFSFLFINLPYYYGQVEWGATKKTKVTEIIKTNENIFAISKQANNSNTITTLNLANQELNVSEFDPKLDNDKKISRLDYFGLNSECKLLYLTKINNEKTIVCSTVGRDGELSNTKDLFPHISKSWFYYSTYISENEDLILISHDNHKEASKLKLFFNVFLFDKDFNKLESSQFEIDTKGYHSRKITNTFLTKTHLYFILKMTKQIGRLNVYKFFKINLTNNHITQIDINLPPNYKIQDSKFSYNNDIINIFGTLSNNDRAFLSGIYNFKFDNKNDKIISTDIKSFDDNTLTKIGNKGKVNRAAHYKIESIEHTDNVTYLLMEQTYTGVSTNTGTKTNSLGDKIPAKPHFPLMQNTSTPQIIRNLLVTKLDNKNNIIWTELIGPSDFDNTSNVHTIYHDFNPLLQTSTFLINDLKKRVLFKFEINSEGKKEKEIIIDYKDTQKKISTYLMSKIGNSYYTLYKNKKELGFVSYTID